MALARGQRTQQQAAAQTQNMRQQVAEVKNTVNKKVNDSGAKLSDVKNVNTSAGKGINTSGQKLSNAQTAVNKQALTSGGVTTSPVQSVGKSDTTPQVQKINPIQTSPIKGESYASPVNPHPRRTYDVVSPSSANNLISPSMATSAVSLLNNNPAGLTVNDLMAADPYGELGINPNPGSASQTIQEMTALPNETPTQRTERYNGLLSTLLGTALGAQTANPLSAEKSYIGGTGKGTGYGAAGRGISPYSGYEKQDLAALNDLYDTLDANGNIGARPYSTPNNVNTILGDVYNTDTDYAGKSGGSGGGSRGGYGGYGGGSGSGDLGLGGGYDIDALYDLLNAQLAEYNNQYGSLMDSLLAAYGANNENLDAYYQSVLNALANNYSDTENLLRGQYGNSQQALEDDRRRALQEAYISRMMAQKQLADQLDAYGLTGGASESVMANLLNNYLNSRANVEERVQTSLKDLLQNYLSNLSDARQNYNQSLMNAEQNRLNARQQLSNNLAESQASAANYLANARTGAYERLYDTLAKLALQ